MRRGAREICRAIGSSFTGHYMNGGIGDAMTRGSWGVRKLALEANRASTSIRYSTALHEMGGSAWGDTESNSAGITAGGMAHKGIVTRNS